MPLKCSSAQTEKKVLCVASGVTETTAARGFHRSYRYLVQVGHHTAAALLGAQCGGGGGGKQLTPSAIEGGSSSNHPLSAAPGQVVAEDSSPYLRIICNG